MENLSRLSGLFLCKVCRSSTLARKQQNGCNLFCALMLTLSRGKQAYTLPRLLQE